MMPFDLTNAPETFQALMNTTFKPLLRRCVLYFFDDILVYSKDLPQHLHNLNYVLQLLRDHQLFAKESKCCFGSSTIEYLGHVLFAGVFT